MRKKLAALSSIALLLTGCSVGQDTRLTDVAGECASPTANRDGISLEDNGDTLIFDMQGEDESAGGSALQLVCVTRGLDMPTRISESMSSTRAMDGRQQDSWDGVTVVWTYHPNSGLDAIFYYSD